MINMLTKKEKTRRLKTNFLKLIRDDLFWKKYCLCEPSFYNISRMREYRTKLLLPQRKKFLEDFVTTYKLITKDTRTNEDVLIWLFDIDENFTP